MSRSRKARSPAATPSPPAPATPPAPAAAERPLRRAVALALVVLACLATRLAPARSLAVDNDEAIYTAGVGFEYAERLRTGDGRGILACRENYEHPPLVKLLHGAVMAVAGLDRTPEQAVAVGRAVAVAFACLTAALLFLLSPWAALVFSLHSWEVYYSSKGWLDSATVFFAVAAVVLFVRARGRWGRAMALSAVALGAGVASKYVDGLVALTLLPFLVVAFRRRPGYVLLYVGLAALTFLALDPALWLDPVGNLRASIGFHRVEAGSALYQRFLERHGGSLGPLAQLATLWAGKADYQPELLPFGLDRAFLVLGLVGLPFLLRRSAVLFAWFVAAALFLAVYPIKYPHYTLALLPALALAAGEALRSGVPWVVGKLPRLRDRLRALPLPGEREAAALVAAAVVVYASVFTIRHWGVRGDARPAYNSFAYTLGRLGRTAEARALFAASAQAGGELETAAHLNVADLLLREGKPAEARAELARVLEVQPGSPEGHALLGNALADEGRLDDALREYLQVDAGRLPDPGARASLYVNLGSIHLRQGRFPEARAALEQAIRLAPANGEAHHLLGLASFLGGDPARAEGELRAAIGAGVTGWKVHHDLGVACAQQGRYPQAIAAWEEALRLDPAKAETRRMLEDARRRVR